MVMAAARAHQVPTIRFDYRYQFAALHDLSLADAPVETITTNAFSINTIPTIRRQAVAQD